MSSERISNEGPVTETQGAEFLSALRNGSLALPLLVAGAAHAEMAETVVKMPQVDISTTAEKKVILGSPKFTSPLVDTPQTISVVPREVFEGQGAQDLSDVLKNTPGITFLAGEGGNATSADGNSFFLRGFDASASVFVDGVRDTGQYDRDVFNLEQVEIAKGPAGSDVGRSSAAGYVNLTTKVPRLETFTAGTVAYGTEDKKRLTFDTNQVLGGGETSGTAIRVNGMWQEGGVVGRNVAETKRWSLAPSIAFGLGTPTRVYASVQRFQQNDIPDYGLPRAAVPGSANGGGGSYSPPAPHVDWSTSFATKHDFDDVTSDTAMARIEHDVRSGVTLSNQTRYNTTERFAFVTSPGNYDPATGLVARSRQGNQRENESLSNLTNLRAAFSTGQFAHQLSAGLEYLWENLDTVGYTSAAQTGTPLVSPDANSLVIDPTRSGASTAGEIATWGLYAFDTVKLNERWHVTGGLRFERYDVEYRSVAATGVVTDVSTDDITTSGKLGLIFKPAPNGTLYFAYGSSVRPPGTNPTFSATTSGTSADNINADPQEARHYELGAKWDFFRGLLSTTFAVFDSKNENETIATDAVTGAPVQTGTKLVKGAEFGVYGKLTNDWLLFGGYGYMDSENRNPSSATANDAEIQWTPRHTGNVWTTYRLPIGLTLGGGAQYVGDSARSTSSAAITNIAGIESYWLFNLVAAYEVSPKLRLRLNVNNLLDEEYFASVNNNGGRFNPGAPRNFLLSAEVRF